MLLLLGFALLAPPVSAQPPKPTRTPLVRSVDLNVGESARVELCDGSQTTVKLLDLQETRDTVRDAVRRAVVTVEVGGERTELVAATYHLPTTITGVRIDCAVTKGYTDKSSKKNVWGLLKDARLRLWPATSPLIDPATFSYPAKLKWFASDTQMANVPVFVDGGEVPANKSIYYHSGLDIGGAEGLVEIVAATDGFVISAGMEQCGTERHPMREPRRGAISVRGDRGWYYRYSHLCWVDPAVKPGTRIKRGQKLGLLGGFNAFRYHRQTQAVGDRDDRLDQRHVLWIVGHIAHKTAVDLEDLHGQVLQVAERRVPGDKVIHGE